MPRPIVRFTLLVVSLLAALGIAELGLRSLGYRPWAYGGLDRDEPTLHEPDPVLGWVSKPGHHRLPARSDGGAEIEVTIRPDGSRATGAGPADVRERVVLVGCSVTVGYGLSDADTFAWKVQRAHPELRIVNFGTAAYGTLQSLLRIERVLAEAPPPRLVLYGFITQHESRNVATYDWLRGLQQHSRRGHVAPPHVTLGTGDALVRHAPEEFHVWPLADRLVTARVAGDATMHLVTSGRAAQGPEATKRLLLEMARLARRHSTPFAVLFLLAESTEKKQEYLTFFQENDIPFVDCVEPLTDEHRIPGEGHPNAQLNSVWARCIEHRLPDLLAAEGSIRSRAD